MSVKIEERTHEEIALADPDIKWKLHRGELREKPPVSREHSSVITELCFQLRGQLDPGRFRVFVDSGRLRRLTENVYIPDISVVPTEYGRPLRGRPGTLAIFDPPVVLVVEVWSRSTGVYDVDSKIPEYQSRGDAEIWRLHPYDRTLRAYRRQPDGRYIETVYTGGVVPVDSLPGVNVDLDVLFANVAKDDEG